jgi:hypothetical protein
MGGRSEQRLEPPARSGGGVRVRLTPVGVRRVREGLPQRTDAWMAARVSWGSACPVVRGGSRTGYGTDHIGGDRHAWAPREAGAYRNGRARDDLRKHRATDGHQHDGNALSFALGFPLGLRFALSFSFSLGPGHKNATSVAVRGSGPPLRPNPLNDWEVAVSRRCALRLVRESPPIHS